MNQCRNEMESVSMLAFQQRIVPFSTRSIQRRQSPYRTHPKLKSRRFFEKYIPKQSEFELEWVLLLDWIRWCVEKGSVFCFLFQWRPKVNSGTFNKAQDRNCGIWKFWTVSWKASGRKRI